MVAVGIVFVQISPVVGVGCVTATSTATTTTIDGKSKHELTVCSNICVSGARELKIAARCQGANSSAMQIGRRGRERELKAKVLALLYGVPLQKTHYVFVIVGFVGVVYMRVWDACKV